MGQPTAASSCTEQRELPQAGAAVAVAAAVAVGAAVAAGNGASGSGPVWYAVGFGVTAGLQRMLLQLGRSADMLARPLQVLVGIAAAAVAVVGVAAAGWTGHAVLGLCLACL